MNSSPISLVTNFHCICHWWPVVKRWREVGGDVGCSTPLTTKIAHAWPKKGVGGGGRFGRLGKTWERKSGKAGKPGYVVALVVDRVRALFVLIIIDIIVAICCCLFLALLLGCYCRCSALFMLARICVVFSSPCHPLSECVCFGLCLGICPQTF